MRDEGRRRRWLVAAAAALAVGLALAWGVYRVLVQRQMDDDLIAAVRARQSDRALALLRQGADPNAWGAAPGVTRGWLADLRGRFQRPHVESALIRAAQNNDVTTTRALIEHGANVRAGTFSDTTPLEWAAGAGAIECASLLIEHGADVNARDRDGDTPLHWAAGPQGTEMVRFLLAHGADPRIRNKGGKDVLALALAHGAPDDQISLLQRVAARR